MLAVNPNSSGSDTIRPTVLVAEDEAMVRTVIVQMLRKLGYNVLSANDGDDAIEVFNQHAEEIKLVIFDMTMPTMSGEELFINLKQLSPQVKTLLTSGHHEQDMIDSLKNKGLSGFLPKPFNMAEMQGILSDILA